MQPKNKTGWRKRPLRSRESAPFTSWLTDTGSLTQRLQGLGAFSVILLRQSMASPTPDEAAELRLKPGQLVRVREVTLHCDGLPVVFAHTVLPRLPRGPMTRWLARLGNRSLGALLFAHPRFQRGPLAARRLDPRHPLYRRAVESMQLAGNPPQALWARRSTFSFHNQAVLVTEVFSPHVVRFSSTAAS